MARLIKQDPEHVQGIGMVRLLGQNRLIKRLGLR